MTGCPYAIACMQAIDPKEVLRAALTALSK